MKNLFIDTNIVIDLLAKREPFYYDAATLFSMADKKQIQLSVSSLTIANTNYILLRQMDGIKSKEILKKLKLLVKILPLDTQIVELALNDETFSDFEDGLQYFTAKENGQDLIITRNIKDFRNSLLPTMSAKEFVERYNK